MGYNIWIGEPVVESRIEGDDFIAEWRVNIEKDNDAPYYTGDKVTGNSNLRMPSYTAWSDFCRDNKLYDIFFSNYDGLLRNHPGCQRLKEIHLNAFERALELRKKNDSRPAGLDPRYIKDDAARIPEGTETHDYDKVRLEWLIFWTSKALKECNDPTMYNS